MPPRFISFEGIDGAGKSTHIGAVAERLGRGGAEVLCTREPGGTELAEQLRALVLHTPMDAMTEALLVFAARRDHLQRVIKPALARSATVLCDRYADATFAYQGGGRGFDRRVLAQLESWVQEGLQPDLTLWFDLEPKVAIARAGRVRAADRFEAEDLEFFERVRAAYAERMQADPLRFVRIEAAADVAGVAGQIDAALDRRAW